MSFGTIIRQLRREHNMTQERLAEVLSISPQAVSRWETDAAMPDISLIAPLCNLFHVTSDKLLEIDSKNRQVKIDEYSNAYCEWASALQKPEELRQHTIRKLREGLRLYPDARILKRQLATVLWMNAELPADIEEKRESCKLYAELIEDEPDIKEKCRYISMYCSYARFTDNSEQGKIFAQMLPDTEYSKKRCLALCCENNGERKEQFYDYMRSAWGELRDAMLMLISECENSSEEIINIRKKQEKIHEILFDHDDIVQYEDFDEYKVARALYKAGDYRRAIDYLEICLTKWTEKHTAVNISSWREKGRNINLDENENKANAEDFIKFVNIHFTKILDDERVVALIEKAKQIVTS